MKLTAILLLTACLQVSAKTYSQTITLNVQKETLDKVIKEIEKQSKFNFFYQEGLFQNANLVTISVSKSTLQQTLGVLFSGQPFEYKIVKNNVFVKRSEPVKIEQTGASKVDNGDFKGRVVTKEGEPLASANVVNKRTGKGTTTDANGNFLLHDVSIDDILIITYTGYTSRSIKVSEFLAVTLVLEAAVNELDQVVMQAYGQTTHRMNTGNIKKITGAEIVKQPIGNPLLGLEGRVPGLLVTQANGIPGSPVKVQIRGQNSIAQGSDPLFVIDGIPFAPNNKTLAQISSAISGNSTAGNRGISPFNSLNPADIESIEILKDADATSIYGSRGANGVVLITTKKGKAGKTKFNMTAYTGISTVTRIKDLLNTEQYLEMRREAFSNDGVTPTLNNAYDLLLWDTTRYTDFKEMLIGGTANITDIQGSVSGGTTSTQFLIGAGFHKETTVFPGDNGDNRGSMHFNTTHYSNNRKFNVILNGNYSFDKNDIISTDLSSAINAIPNLPLLYDSIGNLKWNEKGINFTNPLAFLRKSYTSKTNNLLADLQLTYTIFPGLSINANFGYNWIQANEVALDPISSKDPASSPTGSSNFGTSYLQSWIIEPQIKYSRSIKKGKIQFLVGSTLQRNNNTSSLIAASGYTNDNLIKYANAATSINASNSNSEYKYQAFFGRLTYNWNEKYLINLNGRRDGSSRFGPGKQFANFGSAGIAWIFSNEGYVKDNLHFISYGKIRGSYGTAGNDQIGDYQYLSAWTPTTFPYQANSALFPTNLFNPDYSWELIKKIEGSIDLGFLEDRFLLSVCYFRNKSSNQLIGYRLPTQTGFSSITENFDATVQNSGLEIEMTTKNIVTSNFNWTTSINVTFPKNKLINFPGVDKSSYSNLVIGQPVSAYSGFQFLNVDPLTGVYTFLNSQGNPTSTPSSSNDYIKAIGNLEPKYYGGVFNSFSYKSFSLNVFFEFRKQNGPNFLYFLTNNVPGKITNQFTDVLNRWQKPGDETKIQKYTQNSSSSAAQAASVFYSYGNDAKYSDASYARLKTLSLSYNLPKQISKALLLENCRFYIQCQNLITITNYWGTDPETGSMTTLPPLKTFTGGIQLNF